MCLYVFSRYVIVKYYILIYVSGCGNVMFHFGSKKLCKSVPMQFSFLPYPMLGMTSKDFENLCALWLVKEVYQCTNSRCKIADCTIWYWLLKKTLTDSSSLCLFVVIRHLFQAVWASGLCCKCTLWQHTRGELLL